MNARIRGGKGLCQVCRHPQRLEIDAALATRTLAAVSGAYGITISSLSRHKRKHQHAALVVLPAAEPATTGADELVTAARANLDMARATGDPRVVAGALRELRNARKDQQKYAQDAAILDLKRNPPAALDLHATEAWTAHRARVLEIAERIDPAGALRLALAGALAGSDSPLDVDLARSLDASKLATLICRKATDIPDQWQLDALASNHPRELWNCHRQSGKSSVAAIKAIHTAIYQPGSRTVVVSKQRQSNELFKKVIVMYAKLGKPVEVKAETELELELVNGSRIVSLPATSAIRGFTAELAIIDESAYVDDEVLAIVLPMLATTAGRIVALSTPAGQRGWWYDAWQNGGDVWRRVMVTGDQCNHFDPPSYLEDMRQTLPPRKFAQEFMGVFVEMEGAVFSQDAIAKAFDSNEVEPLF